LVPSVSAHVVDALDVARACVNAAEAARNRRYVVAGQRHRLPEVCAQIAQLCGAPTPRAVAPKVALAASGLLQVADRLSGRPPPVTPRKTRALLDSDRQQISSARAQLEVMRRIMAAPNRFPVGFVASDGDSYGGDDDVELKITGLI
jgi:hypothetical protein